MGKIFLKTEISRYFSKECDFVTNYAGKMGSPPGPPPLPIHDVFMINRAYYETESFIVLAFQITPWLPKSFQITA